MPRGRRCVDRLGQEKSHPHHQCVAESIKWRKGLASGSRSWYCFVLGRLDPRPISSVALTRVARHFSPGVRSGGSSFQALVRRSGTLSAPVLALVIGNTRIRAQESSGLKRSNATYNSKVPERTGGGVVSAYHGQGLEPYIQYGDWPVLYKPPILILCAWRNAHLNCSSS